MPSSPRSAASLRDALARYVPLPAVSPAEKLRAGLGACLGLVLTGFVTSLAVGTGPAFPWLIAPMGASSVLLFAVPSSPLAQPWSILGGNLVAGIVGVTAGLLVPSPLLAAGLAAGIAIAAMLWLRCLHPPSGAVALTAVLGGSQVHALGYGFVLWPVMVNSILLLLAALAYNRLTGRAYPHPAPAPAPAAKQPAAPSARLGFTGADLDAVLATYDQLLDVNRADIDRVVRLAQVRAFGRRWGEIRCADIMTRDVTAVSPDTSIREAHALMRAHHVKALPVTDEQARVLGIVTQTDLMEKASWGPRGPRVSFAHRLRHVVRLSRAPQGSVQEIMSTRLVAARPDMLIADLVPLMGAPMGDTHIHALPVVDAHDKLAGIVTQSDLISGLFQGRLMQDVPDQEKEDA